MAKKKPIVITIKETRHKKQPWTYTIDKPGKGPMETKEERYSRIWTAKRGALRQLGHFTPEATRTLTLLPWAMHKPTAPIEWRIERLSKTKSKK